MSSSSIANTLVSSSARGALRNGFATTARVSQPLRRKYATQRPTLPGGDNKPLMIAALVGIPALAYFIIPSRSDKPITPTTEVRAPNLDPAAASKRRHENESDHARYAHPEHLNPEEYKPEFGRLHKAKRVDGPPDNRNHQTLSDRARHHD
ncbi:hypothetical protein FHL15_001498 [Xylaria flabelliformis]|uniref:Uncharacterized protein n=1 Tax=Xylaria flabelliformis TaxID=2512241 RepID=A0A553IC10_9PEZI|nr:hypothetical protein FHL15_001498 [Xylaria flabelliformis]